MFHNQDAITIDMKYVTKNLANDNICTPDPDGCTSLKQCVQINKELDNEIHRLRHLKDHKYNIKDFVFIDNMYQINPARDGRKSRNVRYDPMMYMLDVDGMCEQPFSSGRNEEQYRKGVSGGPLRVEKWQDPGVYRINPNKNNDFKPTEEEYMLVPKSTQVVRKKDFREKHKLRIYPHHYNQHQVLENDARKSVPSMSLGGVDYPIPMYHQLRYLQQGKHPGVGHNIDYDIHLKTKTKLLPQLHDQILDKHMLLNDNVDYDRAHQINKGIMDNRFVKNRYNQLYEGKLRTLNELRDRIGTVGVPSADKKDFTCQQRDRKYKQEAAINDQQIKSNEIKFIPESRFETGCDGCPREQIMTEMPKEEIRIFKKEINLSPPQYPKFPSQATQKSSFFGLGPPLPPPNPMLLSNVPSELLTLMHQKNLNKSKFEPSIPDMKQTLQASRAKHFDGPNIFPESIRNSPFGKSGRFDLDTFDGNPLQTKPISNRADINTNGIGSFTQARWGTNPDTPDAPKDRVPRGVPAKQPTDEYSIARESFEKEIEKEVRRLEQFQKKILYQIADIRHFIPQLKQRELHAKELNNTFDIVESQDRFKQNV